MKKLVLATMVAIMAFSGTALAQDVGVYFDAAGTDMVTEVTGITLVHAYCVISGIPGTGVAGFEVQLSSDSPLSLFNWAYPAESGALNLQSPPTFLVGFSGPMPVVDGAFTAMEFDVYVGSANPINWDYYEYDPNNPYDDAWEAHITPGPIFFASIDGTASYLDENGEIVPMAPAVANEYRFDPFSTVIGVLGPVATDEVTFDGVKSLFR